MKESRGEVIGPNGGIVSYSSMLDGAERFGTAVKEEMKKKGIKAKIE